MVEQVPNAGLVPRSIDCWVCKNVAKVEHVTVLLINEAGQPLPPGPAIEYLASIGHTAPRNTWQRRLRNHRAHVTRSLAKGTAFSPMGMQKLARVEPQGGSPTWVRAPDRAMSLGMDALEELASRLGAMDDTDLVSVARLGISAAGMRGAWEAKGRQLGQLDALIDLAYESSIPDDEE